MKNKKIADSGLRILEVLKALSKSPLSIDEMLKLIADNEEIETVYTRETFNKYINTLKLAGFEIHKIDNKYVMTNTLNLINLSNENIRVFKFLRKYAEKIYLNETNQEVIGFLDIVEKTLDKDTEKRFLKNKRSIGLKNFDLKIPSDIVKKYENFCNEQQKLNLTVLENNQENEYKIDPRRIKYEKEFVYLLGYDYVNDEFKKIKIKDIKKCKQLPQKSPENKSSKYITYRLKNRLAKSYVLKENEKLVNIENDNELLVSNTNEDINSLFSRLLRYGENCEIVYPKSVRESFKSYIDKILEIYDEQ